MSAGVGMGLSIGIDIDGFGLDAGFYGNLLAVQLKNGHWKIGQELNVGITGTFLVYDIGANAYAFLENGIITEESEWVLFDPQQSTIPIFGASCYFLFLGGSYSLRFNLNNFLPEVAKIWID